MYSRDYTSTRLRHKCKILKKSEIKNAEHTSAIQVFQVYIKLVYGYKLETSANYQEAFSLSQEKV